MYWGEKLPVTDRKVGEDSSSTLYIQDAMNSLDKMHDKCAPPQPFLSSPSRPGVITALPLPKDVAKEDKECVNEKERAEHHDCRSTKSCSRDVLSSCRRRSNSVTAAMYLTGARGPLGHLAC